MLVAHAGKQHAYRHAASVQRAGCLERFVTSGYYRPERLPDRWVSGVAAIDRRLRRRFHEGIDTSRVVRRWGLELPELVARALLGNGRLAERLIFRRDARFDEWVARRLAGSADIYWGFQGSCLESLRAARRAGRIAVAEFATAHVTRAIRLLSREAERHPEWAHTISNFRFPDWYRQRLEREPHEADYCIAASGFTRESLIDEGVAADRIELLPLGADLRQFQAVPRPTDGPLRVLFVGGIGQRKGVKYLLEAVKRLDSRQVELVFVGPMPADPRPLRAYDGLHTNLGRMDQAGVIEQMQRSHVLVLPSVFEGFGLVIPEAMATGMPVIASTHTAGPEMIEDGVEGFVLAPDDVDGLAAKLEWLAGHRAQAREMGMAAARTAARFSWDAHAERVAAILGRMWDGKALTSPTGGSPLGGAAIAREGAVTT